MAIARVTEVNRTNFMVSTPEGYCPAVVRGDFHAQGEFPKVGDYVQVSRADDHGLIIEAIEERKSVIKRRSADSNEEQIIAANVDLILIVMGVDGDFNPSRLERYLLLAAQSQISPVIVFNKVDLDFDEKLVESTVTDLAADLPILYISAKTGEGMTDLAQLIGPETTAVLLGSSGAGKSTITNWLLGESKQLVKTIREDDSRGRHTTTSRQLFSLPTGGYLIDTPGMRELGVLDSNLKNQQDVFAKIDRLAADCKFRNCDHDKSAGCAVLNALETGDLTKRELANYHKLLKERGFKTGKDSTTKTKYQEQIIKRKSQYEEAQKRKRLSRGT